MNKRMGRDGRHDARAKRENEQMLQRNKGIKIQHWDDSDKPNGWMIIRLNFKKSIIPQVFEQELREVLERLFNGHF